MPSSQIGLNKLQVLRFRRQANAVADQLAAEGAPLRSNGTRTGSVGAAKDLSEGGGGGGGGSLINRVFSEGAADALDRELEAEARKMDEADRRERERRVRMQVIEALYER